jgi:phospholipid-translocating ATPase
MDSKSPGQNHDRGDGQPDSDSSNELSPTSTADTTRSHGLAGPISASSDNPYRDGSLPVGASSLLSMGLTHDVGPTGQDHRRRNRGYSLRRSIFAQNIQRRPDSELPIELDHQEVPTRAAKADGATHKRQTRITITEPVRDENDRPVHFGPLWQRWLAKKGSHPYIFKMAKRGWKSMSEKLTRSKALAPSPDGRHVRISCSPSDQLLDERTNKPHIDNTIVSCRYTPYDFVPRQLVAQFSKLANFYFLCISILQMIPGLSTTGTYTTIVPLLIFVCLSMAKEGYDDLRRHRLDKEENEREVDVLVKRVQSNTGDSIQVDAPANSKRAESGYQETATVYWRTEKWQHIRVGQVVLLRRDEPIPADIIILHVDDKEGTAFIETKSLDGETNLKGRRPPAELSDRCQTIDTVANLTTEFVVEDPNLDLYKFEGRFAVDEIVLPLTNNEIIYRGSVLRNTSSALGLVIMTGEETKIRMNASKAPRIKAPALQSIVNKVVIFIAVLVFAIALLMAGLYQVWRKGTERNSWYLTSARVPFGHVFVSFIIMFNTMLPLSLYVSLEIVKVCQMFLMQDIDMYDPESDMPMEPHTSTINEDLGQVSYVFSDKTGTLTNNSMKFRKISIAGHAWLHDFDLRDESVPEDQTQLLHKKRGRKSMAKGKGKVPSPSHGAPTQVPQSSLWKPSNREDSLHGGTTEQLLDCMQRSPRSFYSTKARFFLLAVALCHTCAPEKDDDGNLNYQAASPDELALVTAAQDLGYIVTDRQSKTITVKTYPDGEDADPVYDVYEVLDVIEFSSVRKRMSIVVRMPDQKIYLFIKGADTTVRNLLRLAELAAISASTVHRQASQRKSLEAQEVLRRRSTQIQTGSRKSRPSLNSDRRRSSTRDSIDQWLKEREQDVDLSVPRRSNSFYTPRQSLAQPEPSSWKGGALEPSSTWAETVTRSSVQLGKAEDLIDENLAKNEVQTFERCFQHIDDFASEGLRTLLYGYRQIPDEEYREWREMYATASTSIEGRQEKMEAAGEMLESNLELLGCTAIEDKLQKGVPEAIDRLRRAGIKIWMLTGDKRETAINVGYSCRLVKDYSTIFTVDHEAGGLREAMTDVTRKVFSKNSQIAHSVLIVDGQSLTVIAADPELNAIFTDIAVSIDSVICCRASPSQKASLVKTIRTKVKKSVTLAIGDGANDVAMLLEANVGIGIAGKEGMQAARTSDYSIAQFRFLVKLLLVHGRWNYVRICKYTLGTFWKEMLFYLVQAMYQRWNGYTGTSLYGKLMSTRVKIDLPSSFRSKFANFNRALEFDYVQHPLHQFTGHFFGSVRQRPCTFHAFGCSRALQCRPGA